MKFWRINTDKDARKDVLTCNLWYQYQMVFTGDFSGKKLEHSVVLRKLASGDGVFMHHSGYGIVGYGVVKEEWDQKIFQKESRLLYIIEEYEYRIAVTWDNKCDCRKNPLPIQGRLPYMGTYSHVDTRKWNVQLVLQDLKDRNSDIMNNSNKK